MGSPPAAAAILHTTWTFVQDICTTLRYGERHGRPAPCDPRADARRRDPRGELRRAELLEAAIHLIGAHGLDGVTHRAVAAAAGVPAASTSYYFRSKDELIDEALRTLATREIERLRERRDALGAGAADLETLTTALSAWIEEQLTPEGRVAMLAQYQLQLEAARRPEARAILAAWKDGTDDLAETAMRSLGAADVADVGDPADLRDRRPAAAADWRRATSRCGARSCARWSRAVGGDGGAALVRRRCAAPRLSRA